MMYRMMSRNYGGYVLSFCTARGAFDPEVDGGFELFLFLFLDNACPPRSQFVAWATILVEISPISIGVQCSTVGERFEG